MEFENHKDEVPFAHYAELFRNLDPQEALDRLRDVKWDGHEFFLKLLGREYAVSHPETVIRPTDGGRNRRGLSRPFFCAICWKAGMWPGRENGRPSGRCPGGKCISSPTQAAF